jgi:hypothetical protein
MLGASVHTWMHFKLPFSFALFNNAEKASAQIRIDMVKVDLLDPFAE